MIVSKIEPEDIAICVNYVCDEFQLLGGNPKMVATKMEYAIEDKLGWKVVVDGILVGFAVVEDFGSNLLITSLVVHRQYRLSKAVWLLFKEILLESGNRNIVYIPIHKGMWASKLCSNGMIDKQRAEEWVNKLEVRYGRK